MGYRNHRSWEAARLPPAEIEEDALWLRKRQRDERKEMAGSPSFLSSPGGGNTGTEKSWKTHLSWKAVPVCSSHRCKSHTPAYRGEGGTGNPSLSRVHEVRRCVHLPSRFCCKMLAPGQDCNMWAGSHCMLNLGQSLELVSHANCECPKPQVQLHLQSESLWGSKSPSLLCCAVETRAELQQ